MKFILFSTLILIGSAAQAELYNPSNNPSNFSRLTGTKMVMDFGSLPAVGKLADSRLGWSETYWPSNVGGIAYRWNHPNPQPFKFHMNTLDELKGMTQDQLGQLSPAELYDIAQGDYNYTLTRLTLSHFTPRDTWWEGICHGWSQAATHFPEPAPAVITNKDGLQVPFGSSDVKGLLAMHEAFNYHGATYGFIGQRCKVPGKVSGEGDNRDSNVSFPAPDLANSAECKDVNAGSFHAVLTNMVGIHGKSFVADIDRFNDVWNQPVTSYNSQVIGEEPVGPEHSTYGVARRIRIKMEMFYGEELKFWTPELAATGIQNFVSKFPVTNTVHQEFRSKHYEYIVELNAQGIIIGGEWISETRPDFMWDYERPKTFANAPIPLAGLKTIYQPVRR